MAAKTVAFSKDGIPSETRAKIMALRRSEDAPDRVRRANSITQMKVLALHLSLPLCMLLDHATLGHPGVRLACVAALGLMCLPFLRVFMHSQAHWKVGNGPLRNWLLDRWISLPFSISQTGYRMGHVAHHLYDNDFEPRGIPKDLQSTYLFSRNRSPGNMWKWILGYVLVYQHGVHFLHVLNSPNPKVLRWYLFETASIVAMHYGMFHYLPGFYFAVYLPALGLAWLVAAIALYMMHYVELSDVESGPFVYHALNSVEPFFNWFGDNDGYHIEHSLFPSVHPVFLRSANELLQPPREQQLQHNYVIAGLQLVLLGKPQLESAVGASPSEAS
jgi:fatty acid desaturase